MLLFSGHLKKLIRPVMQQKKWTPPKENLLQPYRFCQKVKHLCKVFHLSRIQQSRYKRSHSRQCQNEKKLSSFFCAHLQLGSAHGEITIFSEKEFLPPEEWAKSMQSISGATPSYIRTSKNNQKWNCPSWPFHLSVRQCGRNSHLTLW